MCNIYRSVPDAGTHLSLSHVSPARPPRPLDSLTHLPTSLAGFAIWNCHTNHQQSSPCPPSQHGAKDLQRRHQTGGTLTQRGPKADLVGGTRGGCSRRKSQRQHRLYTRAKMDTPKMRRSSGHRKKGEGELSRRGREGERLFVGNRRGHSSCAYVCVYILCSMHTVPIYL